MRTSIRSCSIAVTGALLAVAGVSPAAATATATATSFVVTHSATGETDPDPATTRVAMPAGALWTIYTLGGTVTDENATFSPWVLETPKKLKVEASCTATGPLTPLPILYAGAFQEVNQINVYRPNNEGDEPYGECDLVGAGRVRITATDGTVLERAYTVITAHPGPFIEPDGTAIGTYEQQPRLVDCKVDGDNCPVSVGGAPAEISLYLTGAEAYKCDGGCPAAGVTFYLNGIAQKLVRLVAGTTGIEIATLELTGITAKGTYLLTLDSIGSQPTLGTAAVRLSAPK